LGGKFPITVKPAARVPTLDDLCASTLESLKQAKEAFNAFPVNEAYSLSVQTFTDAALDLLADI
jgi:hypothetical protein